MKITLNGKKIEVEGKRTILDIVRDNGIFIPSLCDHSRLTPFAGCRLCLAEIKGKKGYSPSCATYAEDGMEILTETPQIQKMRKQILELILSEHPHSCLICSEKKSCDNRWRKCCYRCFTPFFKKQRVRRIILLCRRTRKEMPAFPKDIDAAIEEGIEIQFLVAPTRIIGEKGKLRAIECIRMKLGDLDESGRRKPIPIESSEFTIEIDTLIPAIGERPDLSWMKEKDKLLISKWETLVVNPESFLTSREGVFAGGDVVSGPATVIEAIAAGKSVADSIDKFIEGKPLKKGYKLIRPSMYIKPIKLTAEEMKRTKRPKMPKLSLKERKKDWREVELGFNQEMAIREAKRCLRCELETEDGKRALE